MAIQRRRQILRRIRTVQSTRKITRAFELIAASRIAKAQARAQAARPYAEKITEVIANVAASAGGDVSHPLLEQRELQNYGLVVVTSDRGLAGAYNSTILRIAERRLREMRRQGHGARAYVAGRKGLSYLRFRGYDVARNFIGFSESPKFTDAQAIAEAVMEAYAGGELDRVELLYTAFISAGTQRPETLQLLPVPLPEAAVTEAGGPSASYEFEPSAAEILGRLLPSYVSSRIYTSLLQAAASEQAARRRAMKAATDNAEDLIKLLTLTANQARQAEITTELSEIVGGAEALAEARGNG